MNAPMSLADTWFVARGGEKVQRKRNIIREVYASGPARASIRVQTAASRLAGAAEISPDSRLYPSGAFIGPRQKLHR